MFAIIETNNATHIAIHVPHDGADKTLPALAAMLESNAVFIRKGWQEVATVKPVMGITLGDTFIAEADGQEILIAESSAVIGHDFTIASPEVFASNAKAIKAKSDEITRLRNELTFAKDELARLREKVEALAEADEA